MIVRNELSNEQHGIAGAIEEECESHNERGALEKVRGSTRQTARVLGRLVELLHEKGTIADQDVLDLLGDFWSICSDDGGKAT